MEDIMADSGATSTEDDDIPECHMEEQVQILIHRFTNVRVVRCKRSDIYV